MPRKSDVTYATGTKMDFGFWNVCRVCGVHKKGGTNEKHLLRNYPVKGDMVICHGKGCETISIVDEVTDEKELILRDPYFYEWEWLLQMPSVNRALTKQRLVKQEPTNG